MCIFGLHVSLCGASPELGTEVDRASRGLRSLCSTHLHTAPSESPVEILDGQLPPFGVFHELRAILGGEKQSQRTGRRGCRAPPGKRDSQETKRTPERRPESLESSAGLVQTALDVMFPLCDPAAHMQNVNMNGAWPARQGCSQDGHVRQCSASTLFAQKPRWLKGELERAGTASAAFPQSTE